MASSLAAWAGSILTASWAWLGAMTPTASGGLRVSVGASAAAGAAGLGAATPAAVAGAVSIFSDPSVMARLHSWAARGLIGRGRAGAGRAAVELLEPDDYRLERLVGRRIDHVDQVRRHRQPVRRDEAVERGRVARSEAVLGGEGTDLGVGREERPESGPVRGERHERVLREDRRLRVHQAHVGGDAAVSGRGTGHVLRLVDHHHRALAHALDEVVLERRLGAVLDEALAEEQRRRPIRDAG